jgi:hypothetical protein
LELASSAHQLRRSVEAAQASQSAPNATKLLKASLLAATHELKARREPFPQKTLAGEGAAMGLQHIG